MPWASTPLLLKYLPLRFSCRTLSEPTLPLLSLGLNTTDDFAQLGRKPLALLILVGVPLVIGMATFAGPVIALLFGPAFKPAVPVLVILSLGLVPMFLNSQFAQILTARDRQWRSTRIMMVCAVINIGLNFVLIPMAVHWWHNGGRGAAVALVCTEVIMTIYGTTLLREVGRNRTLLHTTIGVLVAGAAQCGAIWLMG